MQSQSVKARESMPGFVIICSANVGDGQYNSTLIACVGSNNLVKKCNFALNLVSFPPAACTLIEGMSSNTIIPDSFISTEPESAEATALRPSSKDVFVAPSDNIPAIIIRLVEKDQEAVAVQSIDVEGQVNEVEVYYLDSDEANAQYKPVTRPGEKAPEVLSSCLSIKTLTFVYRVFLFLGLAPIPCTNTHALLFLMYLYVYM